jgi:hypothetical protein
LKKKTRGEKSGGTVPLKKRVVISETSGKILVASFNSQFVDVHFLANI